MTDSIFSINNVDRQWKDGKTENAGRWFVHCY